MARKILLIWIPIRATSQYMSGSFKSVTAGNSFTPPFNWSNKSTHDSLLFTKEVVLEYETSTALMG